MAPADKDLGISGQPSHEGGKVVNPTVPAAFVPSEDSLGAHFF